VPAVAQRAKAEAIHLATERKNGLLRFARNDADKVGRTSAAHPNFHVMNTVRQSASTAGYDWNQTLSTTGVALGLLAIGLAVFAVIMKEERLLADIAAALGVAADSPDCC